jgi:GAF domain-containing protein
MSNLTPQESGEILVKTRGVSRLYRIGPGEGGNAALVDEFLSEIASRWLRGELQEPFVARDGRVGVLPVQIRDRKLSLVLVVRERPFGRAEANLQLLRALADHIGVAFENARLYTLATTDELTQLFSMRHFQSRIEEAVSRYERAGQKFGLLMLDLDHFKAINDRWGHPTHHPGW